MHFLNLYTFYIWFKPLVNGAVNDLDAASAVLGVFWVINSSVGWRTTTAWWNS